ncbi:MAG: hypothetical protein RL722_2825 [Pseudomonadota bacterium]|jgi:integrase/recombinase XerC
MALSDQQLPLVCDQWLRHLQVERRLADRTLIMYRGALARLVGFAALAGPPQARALSIVGSGDALPGALPLAEVKPLHVRRWAAQLNAQGLSPRSIAIHLAAWRGLYRWWCRLSPGATARQLTGAPTVPANNPVDGLRAPKQRRPLPKALAVDQAVSLADHHRDSADPRFDAALEARDRAIVELLYGAGLRVGECCGLDHPPRAESAGWLDLDGGSATVLGKGRKRRSVPVLGAALAALKDWLALRPLIAAADEPALFVSRRGSRLTDGQLRRRLAERAQQAGLPQHVHPHMLRHSYASHLLQSSGDLRAVQELLGHAQISTTQVYTRLDYQHLAKVYDAAHPRARRKPGGEGGGSSGGSDSPA